VVGGVVVVVGGVVVDLGRLVVVDADRDAAGGVLLHAASVPASAVRATIAATGTSPCRVALARFTAAAPPAMPAGGGIR
jgi:hypothetical protein